MLRGHGLREQFGRIAEKHGLQATFMTKPFPHPEGGITSDALSAPTALSVAPGMSASLIGHSRSSAFRLSAADVSMSLTGSCFSSESALRPLYGVFFVKEFVGPRRASFSFVGFLI